MKRLNVRGNIDDKQSEAFVLFVQSLDEQLFDYTDDSYKAPALNTYTRTLELQSLASINHAAGLPKSALVPFVDELEWSIKRDPVLSTQQRALCRTHIDAVRDSLSEADRLARSLAGLRISLGDYFENIKLKIWDFIRNEPNKKDELIKLAASFVVQAEVFGFPRRHTYYTLHKTILKRLSRDNEINYEELLKSFFSNFGSGQSEYDCLFLADSSVEKFSELMKGYNIEVLNEVPKYENVIDRQVEFIEKRGEAEALIRFSKIKSPSPVLAHEMCAIAFHEFASIVRYIEHRLELKLSRLSLIYRHSDKRSFVVRDTLDPMHGWCVVKKTDEGEMLKLAEVLHGNHLLDESRYRLSKAVKYHGAALKSVSPENQLVDLWAGLEGLLPKPPKESTRIEFFAESILPSLTLSYPEKLFSSLFEDIERAGLVDRVIEDVSSGSNRLSKFIHLILCDEYEGQRQELIGCLKGNPLLMNRAWRVATSFNTRGEILRTLKSYRQKVKWHIERIYSTRNTIMHNASALPYLPRLIENLHVYFDQLVNSVSRVAVEAQEQISIESAIQYLSSWERYRLHALNTGGQEAERINIENVWDLVFGSDLVIIPER